MAQQVRNIKELTSKTYLIKKLKSCNYYKHVKNQDAFGQK
jgi:hypothetical protein